MEYFRIIEIQTKEELIRKLLVFENLDKISSNLFVIGDQNEKEASIGGMWGEFTLTGNEIRGGLRFALKECPNAFVWTVTTGYQPAAESIVVHLTINRTEIHPEFEEEIEEYLDDHAKCIDDLFR